ncbi:colipase-like protein 2 isoform 1-T1 [Callospermophilus lateralis]|uniref:colipase-like protein 2 isoform X1 n=1 Tax=Callospermophilus lateralis TaxID=76772 RepID=UPI004038B8FE
MAAAVALLVTLLFSCWDRFHGHKKISGDRCSHHSECFSDCCLMDLTAGGAFCAPKARKAMACLPQRLQLSYLLPTDQGSHEHHLPLQKGLELLIQGRDVSPPVPLDLEEDTGWSISWGQRPWPPPTCSKSSS